MATTSVEGRWEAGLSIDGNPVFVTAPLVKSITVRSSVQRALPTFEIVIDDKEADITDRINPKDGTSVSITMGDGNAGYLYEGNFVCLGEPLSKFTPQGIALVLRGTLNNVAWMKKIADKYTKGPSSAVIAALAAEAGLIPDVDATSDVMAWIPTRKPLVQYAQSVAKRAYKGDAAGMIMAVTDRGVLRYKGTDTLLSQSTGFTFGGIPGKYDVPPYSFIDVKQFEAKGRGLTHNASGGYGSTSTVDTLEGKFEEFGKMAVGAAAGSVTAGGLLSGISSTLSGLMGEFGVRVDGGPIDAGNAHEKYHLAPNLNRKIKASFSNDVDILTTTCSSAQLLDKVRYNCINPATGRIITKYSGDYIITSLVRTIMKGQYYEKITLTNQGNA